MALNQVGLGITFEAFDKATGTMGKVAQGYDKLRDAQGRFLKGAGGGGGGGVFDGMKMGLGGLAGAAFGAAAALGGAGVGMVLNDATNRAKEFEFSLAKVRTVIDESAFSSKDLSETTMALAESYGSTAQTQAEALYEVISSGVTDAQQAVDLLQVANEFAVGGTADLAKSVDVLTSAVNTYADQGLTAQKASDLMFTAIAAGKTTASELSQSLGEVAPTAHAAGVSFEELQAAIAALTVQGIKTPQAVTGLNALLSNLLKPSKDAADEAKRLGIEFSATALKSKGLKGVLDQLKGNTKLTDESMVNLFGSIDGVKAALTLMSNDGAKFDEVLAQMANSAGATDKAFDVMSDTSKFADAQFNAMKDNVLIVIGESLIPLKKELTALGKKAIDAWQSLSKPTRDMIVKAAAVVAAIATIAGVFSTVSAIAGPVLAAISGAFLPVVAGVAAAVAAFYIFKDAFDNNVGGIADQLKAAWKFISTAWDALVELFSTGELSGALAEEFLSGKNDAVNFAVGLYLVAQRVVGFFQGMVAGISKTIEANRPTIERLGEAFADLWAAISAAFSDGDDPGAQFDSWASAGAKVGAVIAKIGLITINVITAAVNIIAGFVSVWNTISPAIDEVVAAVARLFAPLSQVVSQLFGASEGGNKMRTIMITLGKVIGESLAEGLRYAASIIRWFAGLLSSFAVGIGGVVDVVSGIFSGDWARVWAGMGKIVFSVLASVVDMFFLAIQQIAGILDSLGNKLKLDLGLSKAVEGAKDAVKGKLGEVLISEPAVGAQTQAAANAASTPAIAQMQAQADAMPVQADPAAAAAAAAKAAMSGLPPVAVTASLIMDSTVVGELVMNAQASDKSRSHKAVPVGGT